MRCWLFLRHQYPEERKNAVSDTALLTKKNQGAIIKSFVELGFFFRVNAISTFTIPEK